MLDSGEPKFLAYCDIYIIKNKKISKLTSYLVDTSTNIEKFSTEYYSKSN